MATIAEPPPPPPSPPEDKPTAAKFPVAGVSGSKTLDDATPWIEYAVQQALQMQKTVEETVDLALEASRSRIAEIRSTSSAHMKYTIESLQDLKSEYGSVEDIFFGKIKEGVNTAISHPFVTCGVAAGLGLTVLKKPRQFLYYKTLRLISNEEALLSSADAKVKELRHSIELLKAESEKLERRASQAEEHFLRGSTKLKHAGKQIQSAIQSAYKVERQAAGLKDMLNELPRREASLFKSQVSNVASEAKRERNTLTKEVSKISNYGISV